MLLEDYLEHYGTNQVRAVVVDAEPGTVMEVLRETDLSRSGVFVKALGWLRVMPDRITEFLKGEEELSVPEEFQVESLEDHGWTLLAEDDHELVYGVVGKFWKPNPNIQDIEADEFREFDRPGFAKAAINFYLQPYGNGKTLLSYELRIDVMEESREKKFRLLWKLIGPVKGYTVKRVLERVKRKAEK